MCCTRVAENTGCKSLQKSPSGHNRTTLSGYIFATKARIDNRKKLSSSSISSRYLHNVVNFGPQAAEIDPLVCGIPANFNGFRVLAALLHALQYSGRQPNFTALNRDRHLHSAGRPSRSALAHILVLDDFYSVTIFRDDASLRHNSEFAIFSGYLHGQELSTFDQK